MLVERHLGPGILIGTYLANCLISAATTATAHRKIGYRKVMQRGRISNTNGNFTLFLTTFFTGLAPSYAIYQGRSMASTFFFYYLLVFYGLLFFTQHLSLFPSEKNKHVMTASNHNETHYAAVALGALLSLALKGRVRR